MNFIVKLVARILKVNLLKLAYQARGIGVEDMEYNGEYWFIKTILPKYVVKDPIFFDVGANKGKYTGLLIDHFPNAKIHSFEPNVNSYLTIQSKFEGNKEVICNNFGLSSKKESLEIYFYKNDRDTGHATTFKNVFEGLHANSTISSVQAQFVTLDQYIDDNKISRIDFLKIDTEGHELKVLQGAKKSLNNKRISIIQFEFNEMNVISRVFLKDFYDLLQDNYNFYRLKSKSLYPLNGYNSKNEIFQIQNIIAIANFVK